MKTIYLPAPYVVIFIKRDLTPAEAWSRLKVAIVDDGSKVYRQPIIDWIRIALMRKIGGDRLSHITMPRSTTSLMEGELL